jgi:hypothetical protein
MVKSLIWLECSSDKGTYIGIDKGSLDTPAPMSGIGRKRPFHSMLKRTSALALRSVLLGLGELH